jgi:GR25 family glycosyltransferase involved in LPS biosynthesis
MIKIFIVHYDKLTDRKSYIFKQLKEHKLEAEFITNYGKDKLTLEDKQNFINISDSEISTFLHHFECYKKIVEQNYDYALILEDDAILCENFYTKLQKYLFDLPKDWDLLYIGEGEINVPNSVTYKLRFPVNIFRKPDSGFKYTDFYLIRNSACKKFITQFDKESSKVHLPIDHYLHNFIKINNLKALMGEPKLVSQGSINKKYNSSIWHTKLHDWNDLNALNPNYKNI